MAKLIISPGTPQAREFELKPGTNFLGRAFANDFQIEDPSVSGSHAQISLDGNLVSIKDLGSTNGTFLNRRPITEGVLQPGHLLRLGGVEMLFEGDATSAVAAVAATPPASLGTTLPPIGTARTASPPIPPPVPIPPPPNRARAATTGTTLLAREPEPAAAEAPPEAAPARETIELPEGKSICKFHPKNPAQWFCDKCKLAFCSLCVTNRKTAEINGYFCRKCGMECAPVKVKYIASTEKVIKEYSDVVVLVRAIGFGFAAALLAGVLWAAMGAASKAATGFFFFLPLMCWGTGALTGYAVKTGCQDRPSVIFSLIAVGFCLVGVFFGLVGIALVTHSVAFLGIYGLLGLLGGMFLAWKFGGGDF